MIFIQGNTDPADGTGVGGKMYPKLMKELNRHCAGSNAPDCFASRGTPPAPVIPEAIFCIKGIVCVSGTVAVLDLSVSRERWSSFLMTTEMGVPVVFPSIDLDILFP